MQSVEFYSISPEVAGELGDGTVFLPEGSWNVERMHYEFHGWSGDDIVTSLGSYLVSERLMKALRQSGLTGFEIRSAIVSTSEEFGEMCSEVELPPFYWFNVSGQVGRDDFGKQADGGLIVSEGALDVLRDFSLFSAEIRSLTDPSH